MAERGARQPGGAEPRDGSTTSRSTAPAPAGLLPALACLLLLLLLLDPSAAFQRPHVASVAPSPPSPRRVGPRAVACDDARSEGEDDASRRDVLVRALRGVGVASAAVFGRAVGADALEASSILVSATEGDRGVKGMPSPTKKVGGIASKIRSVSRVMDELQRDLMQERWDLVEGYPNQLRSYVPIFTAYTDTAFPSDIATDKGLRVALRYEVGRFFASLERLRQATGRRSLDEAYVAYSDMSLHFDRYLRVGGLYTFYDDNVSLEEYYKGVADTSLVYVDPKKDPALVRDLVVLIKGPEKGRTGIVIGIYPDGTNTCAVKLDRYRGIREIRVVPQEWAAKRLGEQDPDDVFLIPQTG